MKISIKKYHLVFGFIVLLFAIVFTLPQISFSDLKNAFIPSSRLSLIESSISGNIIVSPNHSIQTSLPLLDKTVVIDQSPVIAFTFDDGPHPEFTARLLKILLDYDVPATFFIVGKQAKLHPYLVQLIHNSGHELANHSYTHRNMTMLDSSELNWEVQETHELVKRLAHVDMKFFRPPGGRYNSVTLDQTRKMGYQTALWSVFPQDHSSPPISVIRSRVLAQAKSGGVVLFHSGVENTLIVLPELIQYFKKQGYRFLTLSQIQPHPDLSKSVLK